MAGRAPGNIARSDAHIANISASFRIRPSLLPSNDWASQLQRLENAFTFDADYPAAPRELRVTRHPRAAIGYRVFEQQNPRLRR